MFQQDSFPQNSHSQLPPELHETLREFPAGDPLLSPWNLFWHWIFAGPLWFCYLILLISMIYYCVRNDPSWGFWLWIMLIAQPFGAIAYFLVRFLPSGHFEDLAVLKRWKKLRTLPRLESAAAQIGNPHQFVLLGDALREVKRYEPAANAYARALSKEPDNLQALWGAAWINFQRRQWKPAREQLARILQIDNSFKFGDVSLLYGKTLLELNEREAAREHLQTHVRKWRQPEALFRLGKLYVEQGQPALAREQLAGLISDLQASPRSIARKSIFWKSRAQRLLRSLPHDQSSSTP